MFSFGRSSSGRNGTGSEVSRSERKKEDEAQLSRRRSRSSLTSSKSKPKRHSSRREDDYDDEAKRRSLRHEGEYGEEPQRRSSRREDDYDDENYFSSKSRPTYTAEPSELTTYTEARSRESTDPDRSHALVRKDDGSEYRGREDLKENRITRYRAVEPMQPQQRLATNEYNNGNQDRALAIIPKGDREDSLGYEQSGRRKESRTATAPQRRGLDDPDRRRTTGRSDSDGPRRQDSKRSSRSDQERKKTFDAHDAALPSNQFFSEPSTYTQPYRPAGLASDYYGDQGESVQFQPGVRPNQPAYLVNQEQLHLQPPTAEAKPPPEPSSTGQVGAAASFFAMHSDAESNQGASASYPNRPPQKPNKPVPSPKASPGPYGRPTGTGSGQINPLAAAAVGASAGAAASYFSNDHYSSNHQSQSHSQPQSQNQSSYPSQPQSQYQQYAGPQSQRPPLSQPPHMSQYNVPSASAHAYSSGSISNQPLRPQSQYQQQSGDHHYGTAATLGLAGAAAGAYYSHLQHQSHPGSVSAQQHNYSSGSGPGPASSQVHGPPGLGQSQGQNTGSMTSQDQPVSSGMQQKRRRRQQGTFGRLADWWKAPDDVAEFEEYTEYIGVCRDCFDPDSPPGHGPRKHHYHRKLRHQPSRHGSNLRVDKTYRHSSDEERYKSSSRAKKAAAVGLAGIGAAKLGETLYKSRHDFDDTYSVKSGKPIIQQRTSYGRPDDRQMGYYSRNSSNEDVRLQRKSSRSKLETREYDERGKHTRRRASNSSNEGRSRGNVVSVGVGAAGLALAAEVAHRRQSRSRSNSRERPASRRKYYSKRVSPKHSYVDLTATDTGTTGFGSFFSPSANSRKSKNSKGFFSLRDDSSSSSDADLAFGEGTVRRRSTVKDDRRDNGRNSTRDGRLRKEKREGNDTAAILGLAAAGTALAAESSRRRDSGKDRRLADVRIAQHDSRPTSGPKINLEDHEKVHDNDGEWEDVNENDSGAEVDMALAYGGRLSNRQSKESLTSEPGTSKWDWRWNKNKIERDEKRLKRRQSIETQQKPLFERMDSHASPFASGAAAASVPYDTVPMATLPLQYVDPIALPQSVTSQQAPRDRVPSYAATPEHVVSASHTVLQQPQPMSAVQSKPGNIESLAFQQPLTNISEDIAPIRRDTRPTEDFKSRKGVAVSRRTPSPELPLIDPSSLSRNSVSFNLTDEQLENERRATKKEERKRQKRDKEERRWTTDAGELQRQADDQKQRDSREDIAQPKRRSSVDIQSSRASEIDAELERLYAEHKRQQEERNRREQEATKLVEQTRKRNEERQFDASRVQHEQLGKSGRTVQDGNQHRVTSDAPSNATAVIVAGAAAVVMAASMDKTRKDRSTGDEVRRSRRSGEILDEEKRSSPPRRRSSQGPSGVIEDKNVLPPREPSPEIPQETKQERLARKVTKRIQARTPSPVHEDYSKFFVPEELLEHIKEHNEAAQHRDLYNANVVEIAPGQISSPAQRRPTFPHDLYGRFGSEPDHDPLRYPWRVPVLDLIEPTPPGSRAPSERDAASPLVRARISNEDKDDQDIGAPLERRASTGSKVTWGPDDTYVYDIITPEYERTNPTEVLPALTGIERSEDSSRMSISEVEEHHTEQGSTVNRPAITAVKDSHRPKPERIYTLANEDEEKEFLQEFVEPVLSEDVSSMPGALPETPEADTQATSTPVFESAFGHAIQPNSMHALEQMSMQHSAPVLEALESVLSEPRSEASRQWSVFDFQVPDATHGQPAGDKHSLPLADPIPLDEKDVSDLSSGNYRSPFVDTASDLEIKTTRDLEPITDLARVEILPGILDRDSAILKSIAESPPESMPLPPDKSSRASRSEARRAERAMSSVRPDPQSQSTFALLEDHKVDAMDEGSIVVDARPSTAESSFQTLSDQAESPKPTAQLRNAMMNVAAAAAAASTARKKSRVSQPTHYEPRALPYNEAFDDSQLPRQELEIGVQHSHHDSKINGDYISDPEDWERPLSETRKSNARPASSKSDVGSASKVAMIAAASAALVAQGARRSEANIVSSKSPPQQYKEVGVRPRPSID